MKFDCVNCSSRNSLPSYHQQTIQEGYTLLEFQSNNTVVDYLTHEADQDSKPFIFFILDTCLREEEFEKLKEGFLRNIQNL